MSYPPLAFYPWKNKKVILNVSYSHPLYIWALWQYGFSAYLFAENSMVPLYIIILSTIYLACFWENKKVKRKEVVCIQQTTQPKPPPIQKKKGFATIDVRTLWTVVVVHFFSKRGKTKWKASKNERVEGRTENESLLFFTFPPGFFFFFLLFNVGHVYWLTLARQRKRKKNEFFCL